jgi:hypothetical protein
MMAFTTERDGNGEIYVMRADGSAPVNVTNAPSRELSPDWQALPITPSAGQGPAGPSPVRDKKAPRIRLRVRTRQRAARAVRLSVSCDERCSVRAAATVRIAEKRKRLKLGTARRTLRANARANLRLKIRGARRRAVRRALRHDRAVTVSLRVTARDGEGNATSAGRVVQIVE